MTPEAKVKEKVKKQLTQLGIYYTMPVSGGYGYSGVPDILACYKGRFVGIECKAKGNKPTLLQSKHIERIKLAGGLAFVIDENNVDDLESYLNEEEIDLDGRC